MRIKTKEEILATPGWTQEGSLYRSKLGNYLTSIVLGKQIMEYDGIQNAIIEGEEWFITPDSVITKEDTVEKILKLHEDKD